MLSHSIFRLHRYLLPAGFAAIILMMIGTNWLSKIHLENTNARFKNSKSQYHSSSKILSDMSDAKLQRSFLLLQIINSKHSAERENNILKWESEGKRYQQARGKFVPDPNSSKESKILDRLDNIETIDLASQEKIINISRDYKSSLKSKLFEGSKIFNNDVLPRKKLLVDTISQLHEIAENRGEQEIQLSQQLSKNENDVILLIDLMSILVSLLLMLYLNKLLHNNSQHLSALANTDPLTNLPNRSNFLFNLDETIKSDKQKGFAIVFFDIDYFKSINDNYGHEIGDVVIQRFAKLIANSIQPEDVLSRFGGDEFVLMLKSVSEKTEVEAFIKNLSKTLDTSFLVDSNEIFISSSIGVSLYPEDASHAKQLLKNADIAMYGSKTSGRNCYQFYSKDKNKKLDQEHTLSHTLKTILMNNNKDDELSLVYQPLVNIDDNSFNECEALIRWKNNEGKIINTSDYIAISEKSNLIEKVNIFVIEEACKQQRQWQDLGIDNIRININLSGNRRIFKELFKSLYSNIDRYNLKPEQFGIELTERTIYDVSEETIADLKQLRDLGMKIAVDDFGTGYSSLSYLKDLPITSVKIDSSFIRDLPKQKTDVALVNAIISLAHSLDYDVIAEGVENEQQLEFLKQNKCDIAQGYLLHHPLTPTDMNRMRTLA